LSLQPVIAQRDAVLPDELELPAIAARPPELLARRGRDTPFGFLQVFRHRNYRLFFAGQLVSLTGN
jgi:hypothetical protein